MSTTLAPGITLLDERLRNGQPSYVFEQAPHVQSLWFGSTLLHLPLPWLQYDVRLNSQIAANGAHVRAITCTPAPSRQRDQVYAVPLPNLYKGVNPCGGVAWFQPSVAPSAAVGLRALTSYWQTGFNGDGQLQHNSAWKALRECAGTSARLGILQWWEKHLDLESVRQLPFRAVGPRFQVLGV